jgi:glycosyltransferase involved in cell wall biosynthesis
MFHITQTSSETMSIVQKLHNIVTERRLPWRLSHRGGLLNTCFCAPIRQFKASLLLPLRLRNVPDDITVVIGIRNRSDNRLTNSLASLRQQDYRTGKVKITVVDYGSQKPCLDQAKKVCAKYDADLICAAGANEWNRSHCLNIGIRSALTKFTMTSDADIVFACDYISKAIAALKRLPLQVMYGPMLDLPEDLGELAFATLTAEQVRLLKMRAAPRTKGEMHASINVTYTYFFHAIRGYDEYYREWGTEDNDLQRRFEWYGLQSSTMSGLSFYLHQWHPRYMGYDLDRFDHHKKRNSEYFLATRTLVRNRSQWGELISRGDDVVYSGA